MSKAQQLQARVATLPEPVAAEVLDFLEFVAARRVQERLPRREAVSRCRGSFKGRLSHSNEFAANKADEIRMEG